MPMKLFQCYTIMDVVLMHLLSELVLKLPERVTPRTLDQKFCFNISLFTQLYK